MKKLSQEEITGKLKNHFPRGHQSAQSDRTNLEPLSKRHRCIRRILARNLVGFDAHPESFDLERIKDELLERMSHLLGQGPLDQPYRFRYLKGRDYHLHGGAAGLLYPDSRSPDLRLAQWISAAVGQPTVCPGRSVRTRRRAG